MKIFVFERVDHVTSRWHEEGGLVVVAESADAARALIATNDAIKLTDGEWREATVYPIAGHAEPKMYVFPDSGCC